MEPTRIEMAGGITRSELFTVWRSEEDSARKTDAVVTYVMENSDLCNYGETLSASVRKIIGNFCIQLLRKWKKHNRSMDRFLSHNKDWLEGSINFDYLLSTRRNALTTTVPTTLQTESVNSASRGRPKKLFGESSQSSKRRKLHHLIQERTSEELTLATQIKLRVEGKRDAAKVVKFVSSPTASPKRANKFKKCISAPETLPTKMTPERALALYVDNKFTKEQYIDIQQISKEHNSNIFPNYNRLLQAKKECYPADITITEVSGEIKLQSLLDHTIQRLVAAQLEVLKERAEEYDPNRIVVTFKWGCDGASGQSRYKQGFEDSDNDDAFLFLVSLVSLRMTATSRTGNRELILWQNPVPSSTKYCRPIKLVFHKETGDFVKQEVNHIKDQIEALVPTKIDIEEQQHSFHPILTLTMIDGKTCSTLSNTAGQSCHICGATPKAMNNLEAVRARHVNNDALTLGMSSLHAWIKCFECILHIAYRLDIKRWTITKEHKHSTDAKKKQIQERLRLEMKLLADIPKQGYGSSNDGNTARRFFENTRLASDITGVNEELIERLGTILKTICSGFAINIDAFEHYAAETAKIYVREYSWYYMPQSVHKVLIHGGLIIREAIMPIGQLSEEAQEARNKDMRRFREFHARKFSRKETVEDMLHMMLCSSDPLISNMRRTKPKMSGSFPKAVLDLLDIPVSANVDTE